MNKLLLSTAVALLLALKPLIVPAQTIQNKTAMTNKVITITKVKSPWYATSFILRTAFKKSIPEYAKKQGLLFKYYTICDDGRTFGGIYLWQDMKNAKLQFSDEWFSTIKNKYKAEGKVEYYSVIADTSFVSSDFDFSKIQKHSVSILLKGIDDNLRKQYMSPQIGLLRSYITNSDAGFSAILLFSTNADADNFIIQYKINNYEFFKTPVLLNNRK